MNQNTIETAKDPIEALLHVANDHATLEVRDQLIELEVDLNGRFVGFDAANHIWHKAIPDAA